MASNPAFKCTKCGACCKRAGMMGLMPQREDGACVHLTQENECAIYESRPDFCNVDKGFTLLKKKNPELTVREYYRMNNELCNQWIKEDGLADRFLIPM